MVPAKTASKHPGHFLWDEPYLTGQPEKADIEGGKLFLATFIDSRMARKDTAHGLRVAVAGSMVRTSWQDSDLRHGSVTEVGERERRALGSCGILLRWTTGELLDDWRASGWGSSEPFCRWPRPWSLLARALATDQTACGRSIVLDIERLSETPTAMWPLRSAPRFGVELRGNSSTKVMSSRSTNVLFLLNDPGRTSWQISSRKTG
jgi:hypothetical protein